MKKLVKFIIAIGAVVGGAAGVLYFLDRKKNEEDFDEFDDSEFDDVFEDDEEDGRDYVTLDLEDETGDEQ